MKDDEKNKMVVAPRNKEVKKNEPLTVEELISKAVDKKVPVESLEKLLAMRRELKQEWAKEEYNKAMARFQADCPTIIKTKEVPMRSGKIAYRYAPIESIVAQVKEVLEANGFSYSTDMELSTEAMVKVSVKVTHIAGHSEITTMTVPLGTKTDIMSASQVVAAAQTFAKRYAFCNAFGILTGDEDTDARPAEESDMFQRAKNLIQEQKSEELLKAYREKIKTSNNYTEGQKEDLIDAINTKLDKHWERPREIHMASSPCTDKECIIHSNK